MAQVGLDSQGGQPPSSQTPLPQKCRAGAGWFSAAWIKMFSKDETVALTVCKKLDEGTMDAETLRWFSPEQLTLIEKQAITQGIIGKTEIVFERTLSLANGMGHSKEKVSALWNGCNHLLEEMHVHVVDVVSKEERQSKTLEVLDQEFLGPSLDPFANNDEALTDTYNQLLDDIDEMMTNKHPGVLGKIDQAVRVATQIIDSSGQYKIQICSELLAELGEFDKAIEVIAKISNQKTKESAVQEVFSTFLKKGPVGNVSEEFTNRFKNKFDKDLAFRLMVNHVVINEDDIEKAVEITKKIIDNDVRSWALVDIIARRKKEAPVDTLVDITKQIANPDIRREAFKNVIEALILNDREVDRAMEAFSQELDPNDLLNELVEELLEYQKYHSAIKIAIRLSDEDKEVAIYDIFKALTDNPRLKIDGVIDMAKEIEDKIDQGCALRSISHALKDEGSIDLAEEVAEMITTKYIREATLKEISDQS